MMDACSPETVAAIKTVVGKLHFRIKWKEPYKFDHDFENLDAVIDELVALGVAQTTLPAVLEKIDRFLSMAQGAPRTSDKAWENIKLAREAIWEAHDIASLSSPGADIPPDAEYPENYRKAFAASAPGSEVVGQTIVPDDGRVPERETWWLAERFGHGLYAKDRSELAGLTDDPWRAVRFKTEREAFDFILRLKTLRDEMHPTEHVFINKFPLTTVSSTPVGGCTCDYVERKFCPVHAPMSSTQGNDVEKTSDGQP